MNLSGSIDRVISRKPVIQEQTAKERKIFALLHPSKGVGHGVGAGHVGEHVGASVGDNVHTGVAGHDPSHLMRHIAESYNASHSLGALHSRYDPVNAERAKRIADHVAVSVNSPNDPAVKHSYDVLKKELVQQFDHLVAHGMTFERMPGPGFYPYKDSAAMAHDVRVNHHLWFLPTEQVFGQGASQHIDHPLTEESPRSLGDGHPFLYNDMLRAVHDVFGHSTEGYQFGARGEDNAYKAHASMFSPDARLALANETRAQNSYVNYGSHLRRPDGSIPKKGEEGYIAPENRPYADQKVFNMPAEFLSTDEPISPSLQASIASARMGPMMQQAHTDIQEPEGGFSLDVKTGKSAEAGFMVARHGSEKKIPISILTPADLHQYTLDHEAQLNQPGMYFGGWHNGADHLGYLDVSENVANHQDAVNMAIDNRQLGLFHLSDFHTENITIAQIDKYEKQHGSLDVAYGPGTSKQYRKDINANLVLGKKVFVYWNIHKGGFSIRQGAHVNNWARRIFISDVKYAVGDKGNERVREEGVKNVHAGLRGTIVAFEDMETGKHYGPPVDWEAKKTPVTYNPYKYTTFVHRNDESPIRSSPHAIMNTIFGEKNKADVSAVHDIVAQEQTAKEKLVFALLHPATGVGHRIGTGHVGEKVGSPVQSIGTFGGHHPTRGFTQREFEQKVHVGGYHTGFDTGMKLHGHMTDKKALKDLKSANNKKLFAMQDHNLYDQARQRGYVDALHKIAGSTPADVSPITPTEPVKEDAVLARAREVSSNYLHPSPRWNVGDMGPQVREDYRQAYLNGHKQFSESSDAELLRGHHTAKVMAAGDGIGKSKAQFDGHFQAVDDLVKARGLTPTSEAPKKYENPNMQAVFVRTYEATKLNHAGKSGMELDQVVANARNGTVDGIGGFYNLDQEEKKAALAGLNQAVDDLRIAAPQFPPEVQLPTEFLPGGAQHQEFQELKTRYTGENILRTPVELMRVRETAMRGITNNGASFPGNFTHMHAKVAAVDQILRNPDMNKSVPGPVKKLTPKQVRETFPVDRPNSFKFGTNEQIYKKEYARIASIAKAVGGPTNIAKMRPSYEVRYLYPPSPEEKFEGHAALAAIDDAIAKWTHFPDKTATTEHVQAILANARARTDTAHKANQQKLKAAVDEAVNARDSLISPEEREQQAQKVAAGWPPAPPRPVIIHNEFETSGTSPEAEALSKDLHLLLNYIEVPHAFKRDKSAYGTYISFKAIETNPIVEETVYKNGSPVKASDGNYYVREPTMNQHAKVLAHEVGHHYAFMQFGKIEPFSNATSSQTPNRDEIVAEAVAHNLTEIYGVQNDRALGYIFRMSDSNILLKAYYEPEVQRAITESTARILAEIEIAKQGVTQIGDTPARKNLTYVRGWLPGHFMTLTQSTLRAVVQRGKKIAASLRSGDG